MNQSIMILLCSLLKQLATTSLQQIKNRLKQLNPNYIIKTNQLYTLYTTPINNTFPIRYPSMTLKQIIANTINSSVIDNTTFAQIIKVFNIPIDNMYEPNLLSILQQKLKSKLNDIFLSQGKNYQDYLKLPKFSYLKPQTKLKLTTMLDQIWQKYSTQIMTSNQQTYTQTLSYMLPQFRTLNQIEKFHLQIFTQFKTNKFSKQNYPQPHRNFIPPNNYPLPPVDPLLSGFHRPNINSAMPPPFYSKMQNQFMNTNPTMMGRMYGNMTNNPMSHPWMQPQHQPQNPNMIQPSHLNNPNINNSPFPIPHMNQSGRSFYPLPKQLNNPMQRQQNIPHQLQKLTSIPPKSIPPQFDRSFHQNPSSIEEQRRQQEEVKSVHLTGQDDEFQQKIKIYQFIQCPCQGNFKSEDYFECKTCHFYFHHECLNITEQQSIQMCPCCKIKQGTNIFIKIHPQPFGKRWCKMNMRQKLSMFLTERQIQKMKAIKQRIKPNSILQYQLRFLRIPNKNTNHLTKSNNINKRPQLSNNNDTRKFNNLPLPSGYIQRIQPYNVFEISLRPGQMRNSNNRDEQECLYIFGIFMIEKYSQNAITQELFRNINEQNSVGEEYLQGYLIDPQEGLEIKLTDPSTQKPIRYPVRGDQCNHPEVFDCLGILQYYRQYGQKLTQMNCSVCENTFNKMIVDRFLYDKIRENETEIQNDQSYKMIYFGNGRVQLVFEQQSGSQKSMNQNNENQQLDGVHMEDQQKQSNSENNDSDQSLSYEQDNDDSKSLSC